ncbi:MAG TPA: hypothetical protein VE988_10930 [Gemmataceae bacterium]|nr:hypothetical protein [Gemmataceae bacterium]
MKKGIILAAFSSFLLLAVLIPVPPSKAADTEQTAASYVVIVSQKTHADAAWRKVVDALVAKHKAQVITFDKDVTEALPKLKQIFPKYACFVAKPTEATKGFVANVSTMTRQLDDDPYTDVIWGVLTGYDADNALRIASEKKPLTVRRVASGTEIALDHCNEGVWYSELKAGQVVRKTADGKTISEKGPTDTTKLLADELTQHKADLFVTSGHASERNWQIGYSYKNGYFKSKAGMLYGSDTTGKQFPIQSDQPRVYLPIGNCLMGHIDGPDAMALAFMNSVGVRQMIGYTVLTWYGYAGWGNLDYFIEQPGRYSFAEAFIANQHALIHRLETYYPEGTRMKVEPGSKPPTPKQLSAKAKAAGVKPQDVVGLVHDRDVVALYGDPAWEARMAPGECAWEQKLTEKDGRYTLEIIPKRGAKTFTPINTNGSQRGYRPIVAFLPQRVKDIEILEGKELDAVVTHSFVLVPNPKVSDGKTLKVVFRGAKVKS